MRKSYSMRRLREVVGVVLQTKKHGGKLLQRDESTLILSNYNGMNVHAMDIIRDQFPNSEINIQADANSSSGYIVIFVMKDQSNLFSSSTCFQLSCVVVLAWCVFLQQSVRDVLFNSFI